MEARRDNGIDDAPSKCLPSAPPKPVAVSCAFKTSDRRFHSFCFPLNGFPHQHAEFEPSLLTRPPVVLSLATFCCLLWGSASPAIKQGCALFDIARHDVASQILFAGVRFVAAGGVLLLVGVVMGWGLRIQREFWGGVAGLGLTQTALQYVFF
jgi:hypothetical protein